MTDRELLELAAKAVGIDVGPEDFTDEIGRKFSDVLGLWVRSGNSEYGRWFGPLTCSGDALWLAVKLKMHVAALAHSAMAGQDDMFMQVGYAEMANAFDPPAAATRRAIVLVAAAVGEQPCQN